MSSIVVTSYIIFIYIIIYYLLLCQYDGNILFNESLLKEEGKVRQKSFRGFNNEIIILYNIII
jgi:hypothetical protein